MASTLIDIQHASVARGSSKVLDDVTLQLCAGEHMAILGPNGCGKSTLLKLLTCELYALVQPETRVNILGRARWDVTELRRRLGVVSGDLPGQATLQTSGIDAVLTGFFSSSTLWPHLEVTAAMRARAGYLLDEVGATTLRGKLVGQMSAGEQRRIMIARALAGSDVEGLNNSAAESTTGEQRSRMLLLDEPSNALDLSAQRELRELLRGLARRGTSIVLITHQVADIFPEMERMLLIRQGRIVGDGSRAELLTSSVLTQLFNTPVTLTERNGYVHAW